MSDYEIDEVLARVTEESYQEILRRYGHDYAAGWRAAMQGAARFLVEVRNG